MMWVSIQVKVTPLIFSWVGCASLPTTKDLSTSYPIFKLSTCLRIMHVMYMGTQSFVAEIWLGYYQGINRLSIGYMVVSLWDGNRINVLVAQCHCDENIYFLGFSYTVVKDLSHFGFYSFDRIGLLIFQCT